MSTVADCTSTPQAVSLSPNGAALRPPVVLEWDDWAAGHFPPAPAPRPDARALFRDAVAEVAAHAKAALPASHGRIDAAAKLVLAGEVELLPDGTATVASQSQGQTTYRVVNGACDCKDFGKAPQSQCKHRLAYGLYKRASALAAGRLAALDAAITAPKT